MKAVTRPCELDRVCGALGLNDPARREAVEHLRPVFCARNGVIHELDLNTTTRGPRRRHRRNETMVDWTQAALRTGQAIVDPADASLAEP
jgi:hypothetical protein